MYPQPIFQCRVHSAGVVCKVVPLISVKHGRTQNKYSTYICPHFGACTSKYLFGSHQTRTMARSQYPTTRWKPYSKQRAMLKLSLSIPYNSPCCNSDSNLWSPNLASSGWGEVRTSVLVKRKVTVFGCVMCVIVHIFWIFSGCSQDLLSLYIYVGGCSVT